MVGAVRAAPKSGGGAVPGMSMKMNLHLLSLPMWLTQGMIAIFFACGFITYYQNVWRRAFVLNQDRPRKQVLYRILLAVMAVGVGGALHLMGYEVLTTAMMFHNLGLFLLVLSLLDQQINLGEYLVRVAALVIIWTMHHAGHFDRPQFLISLFLLALALVFIRRFSSTIRFTPLISMAVFAYIAMSFWLLLPDISAGVHVTTPIAWEAIGMQVAMATVATNFWIAQHRNAEHTDELAQLANYDMLTNAKTYSTYERDLSTRFAAARSKGAPLTLAALDIDHFKQINDEYGHLAGNAVLMGVATTLAKILERDHHDAQIYRTGGEEFNILFPGQTPAEVLKLVRDCWRTIRISRFSYEDADIKVTISIGVTAMQPDDDIESLYKRADDNLYQSKHNGRDVITVEGQTQNASTGKPVYATYTYFTQQIVDAATADMPVASHELLLRRYDYEHDRWVVPDRFDVSAQTQVGMIRDILPKLAPKRLNVNLSLEQFGSMRTAAAFSELMHSADAPEALAIELPQMPQIETLKQMTPRYHAAGITIYIDDVGSDNHYDEVQGVLDYFDGMKYAVQNLRRTGSGTRNIDERLAFWAQVAQQHHLRFIIEGIESKADVEWAQSQFGARYLQGYYFDRPELPRLD